MSITLRRTAPRSAVLPSGTDFPGFVRRLFEEPVFPTALTNPTVGWLPAVDMTETNDELTLTAELPGMEEKDFDLSLENDLLTISGEKKEVREAKDDETRFHSYERFYGAFRRSFMLPRSVDPEKIRAEFTKGVLTVHLPKSAKAKGRHIEVSAG
ncbi:MAG: Hsp20/alpha crystallin family protein [Gemmatimonadetes bacterium]|nr:Hsp20/alpha crystallin family protein [Gemmatimonadota bacterium]